MANGLGHSCQRNAKQRWSNARCQSYWHVLLNELTAICLLTFVFQYCLIVLRIYFCWNFSWRWCKLQPSDRQKLIISPHENDSRMTFLSVISLMTQWRCFVWRAIRLKCFITWSIKGVNKILYILARSYFWIAGAWIRNRTKNLYGLCTDFVLIQWPNRRKLYHAATDVELHCEENKRKWNWRLPTGAFDDNTVKINLNCYQVRWVSVQGCWKYSGNF